MIHASLAIAVATRCAATANLINVMKTASATAYKAYMYIQPWQQCSSFISGIHHYGCIAPNVRYVILQTPEWTILSHASCFIQGEVQWFQVVRGRPGGLLQFSKGKLLRSIWHLIRLTFVQCGWTGRDAEFEQQLKDVVALFAISQHHSTRGCRATIWFPTQHCSRKKLTAITMTTVNKLS